MSDSSLHNEPKALLLIDVQEGFFTIPGFHIHQAGAFLSRVSQLVTRARSEGVPVIHVQHCGPPGHPLERGSDGGPEVAIVGLEIGEDLEDDVELFRVGGGGIRDGSGDRRSASNRIAAQLPRGNSCS